MRLEEVYELILSDGVIEPESFSSAKLPDGFCIQQANNNILIKIKSNFVPTKPLCLNIITTQTTQPNTRVLIICEPHSKLNLIQNYISKHSGEYITNTELEITLRDNSELNHLKIITESDSATHLSHTKIYQNKSSRYASAIFSRSAKLIKNKINISLLESGSSCELFGIDCASKQQNLEHNLLVEHIAPNCQSYQHYRGTYDDFSNGNFFSIIKVHPGASNTDAVQENRNLLLSENASAYTCPQLEIATDDIKCKHGATVGQLDNNALFYLNSRGIESSEARKILSRAFLEALISQIKTPVFRNYILGQLP